MADDSQRFKEYMAGFFHDLLRAAGITMTPIKADDRLRQIGERMASAVEHAAERKSVEVIKRLQVAVMDAFTKTEEELNNTRKLVLLQQEQIALLRKEFDERFARRTD